jgi:acyl carrier protein
MSEDTDIEQALVAIWSEILGFPTVGVQDDFFELGGHSLLAGQILTRVRRDFGVQLKLREFFDDATVAGLATRIRAALPAASSISSRPISNRGPADQR